jgi:methylmalonyl-CoA mutase N-terminal domain/subunit
VSHEVETEQVRGARRPQGGRDEAACRRPWPDLVEVAGARATPSRRCSTPRAEATLARICGVLRDLWGSYTEPPRF